MDVFVNWLEFGLLNDFDRDAWDFDFAQYLTLKKERDDTLGKFDTPKSYISSIEGKNKELTEKAAASSREVKRLRNEVKSLGPAQEKSSEDITRLTFEKDRAEKKVTELSTALE